jgi:hypothetical protein
MRLRFLRPVGYILQSTAADGVVRSEQLERPYHLLSALQQLATLLAGRSCICLRLPLLNRLY